MRLVSIAGILFLCWAIVFESNAWALDREKKKASKAISHYIMGLIYDRLDQVDKAIQEYSQAAQQDYTAASIHLRLAAAHIKNNAFDSAISELNLAKKFDPESFQPQVILSLLYASQGKLKEASLAYEEALNKAKELQPKNIQIYKSLGEIYIEQKRFDEAIKTYQAVLGLAPEDAEAHFFLGTIYEEQGKRKQSLVEFKEALRLKPDFADALNSLGYLYAEEGINLDEAEVLIKKALDMEPDNGAYVDSLGWVYFKRNKLDAAIEQLERASNLMPDPIVFEHLGDACIKNGLTDKARQAWKKSLELNPEQKMVKEKLEKLK